MIRKVLVVRFRRVGDAVVSSVICNTLRLNFPDAEIHYVLNEAIAPLFEGHPAVDRVIPFSERENHTPRLYLRKVWRVMRRGRYDALIDLRGTLKTSWFSIFAPGVPYRIGRRKWYNCLWFNHRVTFSAAETVSALVKGQDTFAAAGQPLPNYEVTVPKDSPLIGRSIGELKFWQSTGGTIVAIRRGQTVILSPGPYAELYGGDVIILVGSSGAAEAAHRLVTTKE